MPRQHLSFLICAGIFPERINTLGVAYPNWHIYKHETQHFSNSNILVWSYPISFTIANKPMFKKLMYWLQIDLGISEHREPYECQSFLYLNPVLTTWLWYQRLWSSRLLWNAYSKWNLGTNRGSKSSSGSGNYGRAVKIHSSFIKVIKFGLYSVNCSPVHLDLENVLILSL